MKQSQNEIVLALREQTPAMKPYGANAAIAPKDRLNLTGVESWEHSRASVRANTVASAFNFSKQHA